MTRNDLKSLRYFITIIAFQVTGCYGFFVRNIVTFINTPMTLMDRLLRNACSRDAHLTNTQHRLILHAERVIKNKNASL